MSGERLLSMKADVINLEKNKSNAQAFYDLMFNRRRKDSRALGCASGYRDRLKK
jgi:hypothetical protein